jgi:hypothetical protein
LFFWPPLIEGPKNSESTISTGEINMKCIIKGSTYNTDTANLVADRLEQDERDGSTTETRLYQSPGGVFFAIDAVTRPYKDADGDEEERVSFDWQLIDDAVKYCERRGLTIYEDFEGMPPEATPPETPPRVVKIS